MYRTLHPAFLISFLFIAPAKADDVPADIEVLFQLYRAERAEAEEQALLERERRAAANYNQQYVQQCHDARDAYQRALLGWAVTEHLILKTPADRLEDLERLRGWRDSYASQLRMAELEAREAGYWHYPMEAMLDGINAEIERGKNSGEGETLRASRTPGEPLPTFRHDPRNVELGITVDFPLDTNLPFHYFYGCEPDLFVDMID